MSMRLDMLAHGIAAVADEHADLFIEGITSDSRQAAPGWLFAAIPGGQADGAKFAGFSGQQWRSRRAGGQLTRCSTCRPARRCCGQTIHVWP